MDQPLPATTLSVIVPAYNEQYLVEASLRRLTVLAESPWLARVQIIVVDDCSTDATAEVLRRFRPSAPSEGGKLDWVFLFHEANQGKGGAIRTGLEHADGELTVIHDADLEYQPRDLLQMTPLFWQEGADAVYGSRYMAGGYRRVLFYRHTVGNKVLTLLCNLACDLDLSDMETCYKMVRTELLKSIPLESRDFRIEPELTIKLAKRGARIFEVPISYSGRTYQEGKKINWKDGVRALAAIVRFRFSDRICKPDPYGSDVTPRLGRAPKYVAWFADTLRPFVGERVLELGAGVGNLTTRLIPRTLYWAADPNPLFVYELKKLQSTRPYLRASRVDPTDAATFPEQRFDTIICQNVLEHVADDVAVLRTLAALLAPQGRVLLLAPHGPGLYGSLDMLLGHHRRYSRESLAAACNAAGLAVRSVVPMNRAATPSWWWGARVLRRRRFSLLQIKLLNFLTPVLRRLDWMIPFPPLTLIAVCERAAVQEAASTPQTTQQALAFEQDLR